MNRQTFFFNSTFNKKPIYDSPTNKYQEFTNTYIYSVMVKISNHNPDCAAVYQETTLPANKFRTTR